MTKKQLKKLTLNDACERMQNEGYNITDYEMLKAYAIEQINNDDIAVALPILEALNDSSYDSDYYTYDYSMGIFDTPKQITSLDDLQKLL